MVTGGYSVDLYCDCAVCANCLLSVDLRNEKTGFAEYGGNDEQTAFRNARASGWRFSRCKRYCFAPGHKVRKINDED